MEGKLFFCSQFFRPTTDQGVLVENQSFPVEKNNKSNKKEKHKNRRSLRKNKKEKFENELVLMGVNAAGISNKLPSFDSLLLSINPTVFFIEETKLSSGGKIKTENSRNYEIFEQNRKSKMGGGIAIGAVSDVEPVLIREGDDDVEILTIEITTSGMRIRCICGYGPQENQNSTIKEKFWTRLGFEIDDATENNASIIIQMDGNLWAGPETIKNDPHQCNQNGKFLKDLLKKYPQLCVVNNLESCVGSITRRRTTIKRCEESILDFFIICEKLKPFVKEMLVDEEQKYVLSRFSKSNGKHVLKNSDHNTLIMKMKIEYTVKKPERMESFNFRNQECQMKFHKAMTFNKNLTNCFPKDGCIKDQASKWFKTLQGEFHKSFRKIRFTSKKKITPVSELLEKRRKLIEKLKYCNDNEKDTVQDDITDVENKVCDLVADQNFTKVVDNFKNLSNPTGSFHAQGMWKLKRKVFPKNKESLPFAKRDCDGRIITSQSMLKDLYLDTFVHRLRHRPSKDDFYYLKSLKEVLCRIRISYVQKIKTKPWTASQLSKTLASLKSNKSRDPHGLVNEIFHPGVIGEDLFISLLQLINKVKETLTIPEFMELCNIVAIYKGKGEKMDLANDRGIFIVNVFRSIIMKMIYSDKYDIVDKSISDSNVGARKKKSIRNHIFILNGIINEAVQKKSKPVDIVIVDYKQCFDSLWLDECVNDLFEAGVCDDKLALIYKFNSSNQVAVKSPFGVTKRIMVDKIVLQGEVFGPLQCSVTVDTFGKECMDEQKNLYVYKGEVGVPPLAMVDDVACPAVCGVDSVQVTAFLNSKSNVKKLQFGVDKCHQLHFGGKHHLCPDLHIDKWEVTKCDEAKTGFKNLKDEYLGDHKLESVDKEKYLGDVIATDGTNMKNVTARKEKSIGIIKQISSILEDLCFGSFHLEVFLILRESLFISSILTNCESWYNVRRQEIDILEKCDENLLRKVLETPCTTPKCMLYLETGCKPIRFIIMKRRLMFLYYILNEDEKSLISRFFQVQLRQPCKGDWCTTVIEDLEYLEIHLTLDQIKSASKGQFSKLIDECIVEKALIYLSEEKKKKSKVSQIVHNDLNLQKYFNSKDVSLQLSKFIFVLRSRMLEVQANFPSKFSIRFCPVCKDETTQDDQAHLLLCPQLNDQQVVSTLPNYEDLFSKDLNKQVQVASIIHKNFRKRLKICSNAK